MLVVVLLLCAFTSICTADENQTENLSFQLWPPAIKQPWFPLNGLDWENTTVINVNISINDPLLISELDIMKIRFECEDTHVCEVLEHSHQLLLFDKTLVVGIAEWLDVSSLLIGLGFLRRVQLFQLGLNLSAY